MTKSGYTFLGWYLDSDFKERFNIEKTEITEDITLYAKWYKTSSGGSYEIEETPTKEEAENGETIEIDLSNQFSDVKEEAWYYESILKAYKAGILSGMDNGKFEPNLETSRAMVISVLWPMSGKPLENYNVSFTDVNADDWYKNSITWATKSGIANGLEDVTFAPNLSITREQLATFFYRYAKYLGKVSKLGDLNSFTDANLVSTYATDAMQWAVGNGIISGKGNAKLDPLGVATRAELAAIAVRFLDVVKPNDYENKTNVL